MTEINTENNEMNHNLCRICGKNSKCMLDIYKSEHNGKKLIEMMSFCFNQKNYKYGGLPGIICLDCESKLLVVYAFHTLCYDSKPRYYQEIHSTVSEVKNEYEICRICRKYSKCVLDLFESEHDNKKLVEMLPICLNQVLHKNDGSVICLDCKSNLIVVNEFHTLNNNNKRRFQETREPIEKVGIPANANDIKSETSKIQSNDQNICGSKLPLNGSKEGRLVLKSGRAEKTYRCRVCDKNFKNRNNLAYHIQITHDIKYLTCDFENCYFSHKTKAGLRFHMLSKHTEQSHICEVCEKGFYCRSALSRHERMHTGEKPHACNVCGKSFSDKPAVRKHIIIHSGERPFVCNYCEKTFKVRNALLSHERTHTGERPYECKTCAKTFSTSSGFWTHRRTHSKDKPYICPICQLPFAQRHHLVQHERAHTGERPFVCEVCQYAFSQIAHLRTHQKTHNRETPYACKICPSAFAFKSQLSSHERIHSDGLKFSCAHCGKIYANKRTLKIHLNKCFKEHGFEDRV